jgi:hypothetical protein
MHAQRWSEEKANEWYAQRAWPFGSNYIPADAITHLRMCRPIRSIPRQIGKELGWAEGTGMNTMRVFLHDLLWQQDAAGFRHRIDTFLGIADKHHSLSGKRKPICLGTPGGDHIFWNSRQYGFTIFFIGMGRRTANAKWN